MISKSATQYINKYNGDYQYVKTNLEITEISGGVQAQQTKDYFIESGNGYKINLIMPGSSSNPPPHIEDEEKIVVFYRGEDGSEGVLGRTKNDKSGDAVLEITADENPLPVGIYEIYAVYTGGTEGEDNKTYFLPCQADSVTLHVVDAYRITYHLNGGYNPDSREYPALLTNESSPVTLTDPVRNYYEFDGWYYDEAMTQPLEGSVLDPSRMTGDIDLYAKWIPIPYSITYELNGGVNDPANPASYTVEDMVVLRDPSRNGYIFRGWYNDAEFSGDPVTVISGASCSNITLYAKWEEEVSPFDQDEETGIYYISSYEDLVNMAQRIQENPEKYASASYRQTANINCEEKEWNLAIGSEEHPFEGTYEGYDYYILGLRAASDVSGLFGVIGENGKVQNLSVIDFDYPEAADVAGGIAGINRGTISGCGSGINLTSAALISRPGESERVPIYTLNSDVKGISYAGGITGKNEGTIINSRSNANAEAAVAGGIAGQNTGIILNVYNVGNTLNGTEQAGGIAGENCDGGSIRYGYSGRTVSGETAGGIAGTSEDAEISNVWYNWDCY